MMSSKNPATGTAADLNLATMVGMFNDENMARDYLEEQRWFSDSGPVCPHCQANQVYKLTAKEGSKSPVRPGVYKCAKCRKQFTARIGTILEESKIPIIKWLMAINLMTSSKKGVSSHQIARECGITQKSAWFLNHRIREAMKREPMASTLKDWAEFHETNVGGKPRKGTGKHKRGRSNKKTPVMGPVERDGNARAFPMADSKSKKGKRQPKVRIPLPFDLAVVELLAVRPNSKKKKK